MDTCLFRGFDANMGSDYQMNIEELIQNSWSKITPFWPLKNLIAVNPLAGFEDLDFKEALKQSKAYFQQENIPKEMTQVNLESIKWLQAYFDEGQAVLPLPLREKGFLKCIRSLIAFDFKIHQGDARKIQWVKKIPQDPKKLIIEALSFLRIEEHEKEIFLTLMLSTLSGWASHIQYKSEWADDHQMAPSKSLIKTEYLAFRLMLVCLIWPEAKELLFWHQKAIQEVDIENSYKRIEEGEKLYQRQLFEKLDLSRSLKKSRKAKVQMVFCIDVRSESFRRALELQGDYETYGAAGFFGVPSIIENTVTGESYSSCPVLLKPSKRVFESPKACKKASKSRHERLKTLKSLYHNSKYSFTTPFALVELMGSLCGAWMALKSLSPKIAALIQSLFKKNIAPEESLEASIEDISFEEKVSYAENALKMMGLVSNFAPLVVLCGHGSKSQNNAYATILDCGACGGRRGGSNAKILALILNSREVRSALRALDIHIPAATLFLAAQHNTTTDELEIFNDRDFLDHFALVESLKDDLEKAKHLNNIWRCREMGENLAAKDASLFTKKCSLDWAQVRPEWGLAKNAAFIAAPRDFTKGVDLEGRSFLHSYEWQDDCDASVLAEILTSTMIVAQWINAQYFFSTLDNVAFGAGSKISKNITGKIGVMQGNASDLMHGLPLQSVYKCDKEPYHQAVRLSVVVYAPKSYIMPIIEEHSILKKLFSNGWLNFFCFDPKEKEKFQLQRDLSWGAVL